MLFEYFKRYSISVGELGVNTATLETNLHNILELASVWKAVVLLDEGISFLLFFSIIIIDLAHFVI